MWSVDYVQVPKEENKIIGKEADENNITEALDESDKQENNEVLSDESHHMQRVQNLAKQMSISADFTSETPGMYAILTDYFCKEKRSLSENFF